MKIFKVFKILQDVWDFLRFLGFVGKMYEISGLISPDFRSSLLVIVLDSEAFSMIFPSFRTFSSKKGLHMAVHVRSSV